MSREEQQNTENSQEQQQESGTQQEQAERDAVPVVLIDVPNPEADNAANASAGARQESAQPTTEAMDVDSEGEEGHSRYIFRFLRQFGPPEIQLSPAV